MKEAEKFGKELFSGKKAENAKDIINSKAGQSVGKMIDGKALKKALAEGDKDTMNRIINQVMSTEDGKALVKQISERFGK